MESVKIIKVKGGIYFIILPRVPLGERSEAILWKLLLGEVSKEVLLNAEAKLGEILSQISIEGNTLTSVGGRKATLPQGISHKQSHYAQQLWRYSKNDEEYQDLIEQAVKEALEKENEINEVHNVYTLDVESFSSFAKNS